MIFCDVLPRLKALEKRCLDINFKEILQTGSAKKIDQLHREHENEVHTMSLAEK